MRPWSGAPTCGNFQVGLFTYQWETAATDEVSAGIGGSSRRDAMNYCLGTCAHQDRGSVPLGKTT
jgi:hypothetical protein